MSQHTEVVRVCDVCGSTTRVNPQAMRPEDETALSNYLAIAREFIGANGQAVPVIKHACSKACSLQLLEKGIDPPAGFIPEQKPQVFTAKDFKNPTLKNPGLEIVR